MSGFCERWDLISHTNTCLSWSSTPPAVSTRGCWTTWILGCLGKAFLTPIHLEEEFVPPGCVAVLVFPGAEAVKVSFRLVLGGLCSA